MSFSGNQYPNFADKVITTRGDIIRGDSSGERERYGIGAANTVLTSDGTDPAWAAHGGVPTTTKGDISGFSTTQARIPISTNNYSLLADSAQTLGLKWAASSTSTLTTTGDLLAASAANTLTRIAGGASGEVLTGNGAGVLPTFQAAGGGAWELLDSTELGSSASSYTFTPSPVITNSSYQAVAFLITAPCSASGYLTMTVNGITDTAYNSSWQNYDDTTGSYSWLLASSWRLGKINNNVVSGFTGYLQIGDADETLNRMPMKCSAVYANETSFSGGALNTDIDDIDEIKIETSTGTMNAGSTIAFYGIKRT